MSIVETSELDVSPEISCAIFPISPSIDLRPVDFHLIIFSLVQATQLEKDRRRETELFSNQALENQ